jgi:uncharacterized protein YqeY
MALLEKIDRDLKSAMLSKDEARLSTLRFLKSAVQYAAIEKSGALADAEVLQVIQKQIKQRRESIAQFTTGGRKEMAAKEENEARILEAYLPKQLSGEELRRVVEQEVKAQGATSKKDFGRLMKHLTEKLAGAADNKSLSEALGKLLS